jgi:tight adherence protein B
LTLGAAAFLVVTALGGPAGLLLTIPLAVLGALARVLARDYVTRRRTATRRRAASTAMRILAGELEAGAQPDAALAAAAAAIPEMAEVFGAAAAAAASGADAGGVLADQRDPQLRAIGVAWQLSTATGAALTTVLSRIAADFAAVDEQRRAVTAALAGPRSSALVLALLPALGVVLGAGMGAHPLQFLVGTPAGRLLCCVGVVLDALGVLWMRALLRRAEQA